MLVLQDNAPILDETHKSILDDVANVSTFSHC